MAKILIVDDRPVNREFLLALLGHGGHTLLEAVSGEDALAVARAERPDLVICDILTPTMNGYEFVRRIRDDPDIASTRVIFQTAPFHEREAGRLTASGAHDLNNLLTVIIGNSELLVATSSLDAAGRESAGEILAAGKRAAALTRQLLAVSRRQALAPRVLNMNAVVIGAEKRLHQLLGDAVRWTAVLAPDPWPVVADPGVLDQVLMTLAVNARDAMPSGGQLTVETRNVPWEGAGARSHPDTPPGPYSLLRVSATGSGTTAEEMDGVLEPFVGTEGTESGLATVSGLVRRFCWWRTTPRYGRSANSFWAGMDIG